MTDRGEVLWVPSESAWTATQAGRFARHHGFDRYEDLHRWSVTDLEGFWAAIATWFEVRVAVASPSGCSRMATRPCPARGGSRAASSTTPSTRSARGRPTPTTSRSSPAARRARPCRAHVGELLDAVARCAAGLRRLGVGRGDRVVGLRAEHPRDARRLPRHRLARRGVVELRSGVRHRVGDRPASPRSSRSCCSPSTATATGQGDRPRRRGRRDRRRAADAARRRRRSRTSPTGIPDGIAWSELLAGRRPGPLAFEAVPFDHPLYVLFSSGTTGLPKADRARPRRHHRSSTSRCSRSTRTSAPATASPGSPRPAG